MGFLGIGDLTSSGGSGGTGLPPGVGPANYSYALTDALGRMNQSFAPSEQVRNQQYNLINSLQQAAAGGVPSAAELQQQVGLSDAQKMAASTAASQRGINPAMAARLAAQQQSGLASNAIGQGSMLRAQEQSAARNALAQALSGIRGQDLQQVQTNQQGVGLLGGLQNQQQAMGNQLAEGAAGRNAGLVGGVIGALGGAGSSLAGGMRWKGGMVGAHRGGMVGKYASGGTVEATMAAADDFINAIKLYGAPDKNLQKGIAGLGGMGAALKAGSGGSEIGAPAEIASPLASQPSPAMYLEGGGFVPGEAKKEGDSPENDTVPALLSPGEIVIPRTLADNPEKAKSFIESILENRKSKEKKMQGNAMFAGGKC